MVECHCQAEVLSRLDPAIAGGGSVYNASHDDHDGCPAKRNKPQRVVAEHANHRYADCAKTVHHMDVAGCGADERAQKKTRNEPNNFVFSSS